MGQDQTTRKTKSANAVDAHSKSGPLLLIFFLGRFFPPLAVLRAIATACPCGRPDFFSSLMLDEIVFLLLPFLSGITARRAWVACA